ncbi:MAG TPA: cytochrome C oxidase subunit IV family protein [Dehalococcoidia bacterium]
MKPGLIVIVVLAVFTAAEYIIATQTEANLIPLVLIAQVKAALIIWYFMHVARAWIGQGHRP